MHAHGQHQAAGAIRAREGEDIGNVAGRTGKGARAREMIRHRSTLAEIHRAFLDLAGRVLVNGSDGQRANLDANRKRTPRSPRRRVQAAYRCSQWIFERQFPAYPIGWDSQSGIRNSACRNQETRGNYVS